MTIEFQNSAPAGTSEVENGNATQQPTSAPHGITNNNNDITNPFAEPTIKNSGQANANAGNQPNQPSQPQVTFADIVKQKQFGSLARDLFDKVNEGDVDSFNSGLQDMMRNVYQTAIEDSNKLMNARLTDFESQLMNKLATDKKADGMLTELKSAVPFAQEADVEPIARQVFSGYLRQGMSKNEALAATNAYFNRLAEKVGQSNNQPKSNARRSDTLVGKAALDELFN